MVVGLIAITHGTIDAYVAFIHPLLPRIMEKLGLSIALAATLVMILSVSSSLLQPLFGYLADRYGRRPFLALGPVVTGVFLSLMGLAPSFGVLLALLILGGLGSSAFHPPGASMVARAEKGAGSGKRLSVFAFGGAAGFALGPIAAVAIVGVFGLAGLWIAMVPGVVFGLAMWLVLRGPAGARAAGLPPSPAQVMRLLRGPLGLLFGISVVGSFAQRTFLTMMPIIVDRAGGSEAAGAAVLSAYLGAQALGTLTSGVLADRLDRQRMLIVLTSVAVPAHLIAILATPAGPLAIGAAMVSGFVTMAIVPPVIVIAQEMVPGGTGASSGIVMGFAWAFGALGIPLAGLLGDAIGPAAAAAWAMPAFFIGTLCAARPSLRPYRHPPGAVSSTIG